MQRQAVDLEDKIKATLLDPQNGIRQSEKLNQLFDGTGVKCGEYSENVYTERYEIAES